MNAGAMNEHQMLQSHFLGCCLFSIASRIGEMEVAVRGKITNPTHFFFLQGSCKQNYGTKEKEQLLGLLQYSISL